MLQMLEDVLASGQEIQLGTFLTFSSDFVKLKLDGRLGNFSGMSLLVTFEALGLILYKRELFTEMILFIIFSTLAYGMLDEYHFEYIEGKYKI